MEYKSWLEHLIEQTMDSSGILFWGGMWDLGTSLRTTSFQARDREACEVKARWWTLAVQHRSDINRSLSS